MKLSTYLTISAVISILFGLMFLLIPEQSVSGFGMSITPGVIAFARAMGSMLLGLGVINWLARKESMSPSLRGILWGNLIIQGIQAILNLFDISSGVVGSSAWGGEVIHIVLAAGFAYYLFKKA